MATEQAVPTRVMELVLNNLVVEYKRRTHDYEYDPPTEVVIVLQQVMDTINAYKRHANTYFKGQFCKSCGVDLHKEEDEDVNS